MIGFYNYTVILTYFGLASAMSGMFFAMAGHPSIAILCLLVSGCCDMFDGKIARTRKRTEDEKNFGIQIDSLCDVICFGVLPSVIVYTLGANTWYCCIVLVGFTLCGLIRLGYYNVTEENRVKETDEKRKAYLGLPITFSAFFLPILYALHFVLPENIMPVLYTLLLLIIGVAYITPFTIKKPGKGKMIALVVIGAILAAIVVIMTVRA